MKVIVLGGSGFVGRNVVEVLQELSIDVVSFSPTSNNFNLLHLNTTHEHDKLIKEADYIINCAADVGSLNYVTDKAAEIIDTNSKMILNLYYVLARLEAKAKVINPIANCGFPGWLSLYREEDFWDGEVHDSVLSYGTTRRLLLSVAKCYEMEYGIQSINYFVPNMYGEYDSTDPNKAHALNALISKVIKAKNEKNDITIWGTGKPIREWLYAKDFARIMWETMIDDYSFEQSECKAYIKWPDFSRDINIGQKYGLSITELLVNIYDKVEFTGETKYDTTKQDGAMEKVMSDVHFKNRFPHFTFTPLSTGIENTVYYYKNQYPY